MYPQTNPFEDEEPTAEVVDVPMAEMVTEPATAPVTARKRTKTYPPYRGKVTLVVR